jgi:hypothetical protein
MKWRNRADQELELVNTLWPVAKLQKSTGTEHVVERLKRPRWIPTSCGTQLEKFWHMHCRYLHLSLAASSASSLHLPLFSHHDVLRVALSCVSQRRFSAMQTRPASVHHIWHSCLVLRSPWFWPCDLFTSRVASRKGGGEAAAGGRQSGLSIFCIKMLIFVLKKIQIIEPNTRKFNRWYCF